LKLRGTYRRDRDSGGKIEPEPLRSLRCPVELRTDKLAAGFWKQHAAQLAGMGLLSEIDRLAFIQLCRIWSLLKREETLLLEEGSAYMAASGLRKSNPRFRVCRELTRAFNDLADRFGMNGPKSRRGIPLREIEPSEESAFDKFLKQGQRKNLLRAQTAADESTGPDRDRASD